MSTNLKVIPNDQDLVKPDFSQGYPPETHLDGYGAPSVHYAYSNEGGDIVFHVLRYENDIEKTFRPCFWDDGKWRFGFPPDLAERPVYNVSELIRRPETPVIVCEGEKTAECAGMIIPDHVAITSAGGSSAPTKTDWSLLSGRTVIIWPDNDDAGRQYASVVAKEITEAGGSVRILRTPLPHPNSSSCKQTPPKWDAADAHKGGYDSDWWQEVIKDKSNFEDLAQASPAGSNQKAMTQNTISRSEPTSTAIAPAVPLFKEDVPPWSMPVDAQATAAELHKMFEEGADLPQGAAIVLTLWTMCTYVFDAFPINPRILLTSPEKRCGKSTVLGLLAMVCRKPLPASNISTAAFFRTIEQFGPTILIDEGDTFLHKNDELNGLINSGHSRSSAYVIRLVGEQYEPKEFCTWSPLVIAMIGSPPSTIVDRSIVINLKRKIAGQRLKSYQADGDHRNLRSKLTRWGRDQMASISDIKVEHPSLSSDRAADNWHPLITVATAIGGDWPTHAAKSMEQLQATAEPDESPSIRLLRDIRSIVADCENEGKAAICSRQLVQRLCEMEESQWNTETTGKPITPNWLARKLQPFGIRSKQVWIQGSSQKNRRGYDVADFQDTFDRYLPEPSEVLEC